MQKLFHLFDKELTIHGEIFTDEPKRMIYATDASAYREIPDAVIWPANIEDLKKIVVFAGKNNLKLIFRGAGTSLAGQVVGRGIVVDLSRYLNKILEINEKEHWVRVEPGVVLDELNLALKPYSLFFAPETSTSNRCVIGGMVGNNSSGLHSLVYGTTREHVISLKCILSDGSIAEFGPVSKETFTEKCRLKSLEGEIYRHVNDLLSSSQNRQKIRDEFPHPSVVRRNTGYALDILMDSEVFHAESSQTFNMCKLLAGSEGTLALIYEARLNLEPLPPPVKGLLCAHFKTVKESIKGNVIALKNKPAAIELMDDKVLELTRENIEQQRNRFFVKGNPGAILMIEIMAGTQQELTQKSDAIIESLKLQNLGYHFPLLTGNDIKKAWTLRKAGLGILSNMPGDAKPAPVIEDTAVNTDDLENYIDEFNLILKKYNRECVYYAHISVGELHLRPVLNLKDKEDVELFRKIAEDTAILVKKYKGSLSGEHGDGRLRGEFIPLMVGDEIYEWFRKLKLVWDPQNIFNPAKIVDTAPMDTSLRYEAGRKEPHIETLFDFSREGGILRAVEKCNGSGDCRKSSIIGGTMCPSFQASRDENTTTRARANLLREFLTHSTQKNPFNHKEIYDILDLCLSCKGCKSECPSNVDMAKYKAEFLQHYYDENGISLRARMIAYITSINRIGSYWPAFFNFFATHSKLSRPIKKILGFASDRSIPALHKISLSKWLSHNLSRINSLLPDNGPQVFLFVDEFTQYNDTAIGIKAVSLLSALGYRILIAETGESGRTYISKGLLRTARRKANRNIEVLKGRIDEEHPIIGLEPSAILGFRDEYPELVDQHLREEAKRISQNALLFEEFFMREVEKGRILKKQFTKRPLNIKVHGHCQQKAVASTSSTTQMLGFPENYQVEEIPSGCCGMAGSFGYEKEHYELSMKVGELVLFPEIRKTGNEVIISAPGTSCRHQIKDGTNRQALHPVEIMFEALEA